MIPSPNGYAYSYVITILRRFKMVLYLRALSHVNFSLFLRLFPTMDFPVQSDPKTGELEG